MLSIAKLSVTNLGYYIELSRENYYERSSREEGLWWGRGADLLGLSGPVEPDVLRNIFRGFSATGDVALVQNAGRLHGDRARRAGFDLTFSAPKDLSLLYAATTSESERQTLLSVHERSVETALSALQDTACKTRLGKAGGRIENGDGLTVARFRHEASRENDPQVHTHCLVAGTVRGPDGKWRSLDARHFFRDGLKKRVGAIYREALADGLRMELGLTVSLDSDSFVRVAGVSAQVRELYSKRRAQILEAGYGSAAQAARIALKTRHVKDASLDPEDLARSWREELARHFGPDFTLSRLERQQVRSAVAEQVQAKESSAHVLESGREEKRTDDQRATRNKSQPTDRPQKEQKLRRGPVNSIRAAFHRAFPKRTSRIIAFLETARRRLTALERERIRMLAAGTGKTRIGSVSEAELRALHAVYKKSGMRLVAVTRSSAEAKALAPMATRSMASLGLLKMLRASFVDQVAYDVKTRHDAWLRVGEDIPARAAERLRLPALTKGLKKAVEHRHARFIRNRPLRRPKPLGRRMVLLVDVRSLKPEDLALVREHAARTGTRLLEAHSLPDLRKVKALNLHPEPDRSLDASRQLSRGLIL